MINFNDIMISGVRLIMNVESLSAHVVCAYHFHSGWFLSFLSYIETDGLRFSTHIYSSAFIFLVYKSGTKPGEHNKRASIQFERQFSVKSST